MDYALNDLQANLGENQHLTGALIATNTTINHFDYLRANEEYEAMSTTIIKYLSIDPSIVALALFAVDFQSLATAMDYIYEEELDMNGRSHMRHPYVACLPDREEFKLEG